MAEPASTTTLLPSTSGWWTMQAVTSII